MGFRVPGSLVRLAALNLNHLVALDALLQERSVSQAATTMGVTQSAMSHTLRSLREMLGDPLLVRVGNDMLLTPFAEQTRAKLRRALGDLEAVVSGRAAFEPSTITDTFTIATHDGTAAVFSAPLVREMIEGAPLATLRIQPVAQDKVHEQLASGQVDVLVIPPVFKLEEGLSIEKLPPANMAVLCRTGHPRVRAKLTLAQYCALPHAMGSMTGEGPSFIDHLLAEHGRSRQVQVRTPYLMSLAEIVSSTDLLTTLPTPIAEFLSALWPLEMHPVPLKFEPGFLLMCWHPRFEADPAHVFFRGVVRTAILSVLRDGEASFGHSKAMRRGLLRRSKKNR